MASIIRVKRSTGTTAPSTLNYGEVAYTVGVGTHGNSGSRLFIGDQSLNPLIIGGKYYADLLSIAPGLVAGQTNPTTPANGFVPVLDETRKVDQWNVDNLTLDGNTLSSTDTDGNIILDPNGTGEIIVPDDTYITFGDSSDTKIRYDEATDDRFEVEGADWNFADGVRISISDVSSSFGVDSGALVVAGGVGIGATLNVGGEVGIGSNLTISGWNVNSTQTQLYLFDTTVTNANILGDATDIVLSNTTGITTIRNNVDVDGNLNVDGGNVTSETPDLNLFNSVVTTTNILGAASNVVFGASSGIVTVRNTTLDLDGDLNVDGSNITSNGSVFNLLDTGVATINFGRDATTINIGDSSDSAYVIIDGITEATSTTSGALRVSGGVGIVSSLYVGENLNVGGDSNLSGSLSITQNVVVEGNTTLGNSAGDSVTITGVTTVTGSITQTGTFTNVGGVTIDSIGISSNVIRTASGSGNTLYIDPYPDGLSNEGTVVIKGDLQVDGTSTIVNSTSVTVNEPILNLGDVYTVRTVMETALVGVQTIRLDSTIGLNQYDLVGGSDAIDQVGVDPENPEIATISSIDGDVISINNNLLSNIPVGTQIIIQTAYDTNTDRGISFNYNTGIGSDNNLVGFFGYDDSTGRLTYIPDATITNSVVSGIKGAIDVGSLFLDFNVSGISTRGVSYFNSNGQLVSTNSPEVGYVSDSNYILTTDGSNVPVWTDTLDGGTF